MVLGPETGPLFGPKPKLSFKLKSTKCARTRMRRLHVSRRPKRPVPMSSMRISQSLLRTMLLAWGLQLGGTWKHMVVRTTSNTTCGRAALAVVDLRMKRRRSSLRFSPKNPINSRTHMHTKGSINELLATNNCSYNYWVHLSIQFLLGLQTILCNLHAFSFF